MLKSIRGVVLFVTENCNFSCKYCYVKKKNTYMKINDIEKILNFIKKIGNINRIDFIGGEPLLNFEFIKEFVEKSKKEFDFNFYIVTNGSLINKKIAKFFRENNFDVAISLDGYKKYNDMVRVYNNGKGTYDDIIRGIKALEEAGYKKNEITINTIITKYNIKIAKEFIEFLEASGYHPQFGTIYQTPENKYLSVTYKQYYNFWREMTEKYIKNPEQYKHSNVPIHPDMILGNAECDAAKTMLVISPSLKIYPCPFLVSLEEFSLGSIEDDIEKIESKIKSFRLLVTNRYKRAEPPLNSLFYGCVARSYLYSNTVDSKDVSGYYKITFIPILINWAEKYPKSFNIFFSYTDKKRKMFLKRAKKFIEIMKISNNI